MSQGLLRAAAMAIGFALALASPLSAACLAPTPPDRAGLPTKPTPPARGPCVDAKPGTAGCLGWEAHKHNDDIKAFNEKAKAWKPAADAYVAKLNAYLQASGEYARCEVNALR